MRTLVIRVAVFDAAASLICVLVLVVAVVDAGLLMQYNKYHMVSDNCLCQ